MRRVTRAAADGEWDETLAKRVAGLFDELAPEWHTRATPGRDEPIRDAFDRGGVESGRWLEVGSGTGLLSPLLAEVTPSLVALDLSRAMLELAPAVPPRVQADQAKLPFPDDAFDSVVHINALLFPDEVDRVLNDRGTVVWVCTRGDETPIYLTPEELVEALPGRWEAVAADAGHGQWAVARRQENG